MHTNSRRPIIGHDAVDMSQNATLLILSLPSRTILWSRNWEAAENDNDSFRCDDDNTLFIQEYKRKKAKPDQSVGYPIGRGIG